MSSAIQWFTPRTALAPKQVKFLTLASFLVPLIFWALISYVPFLWHPKVEVEEPGGVSYFQPGMLLDKADFRSESARVVAEGLEAPTGKPANPIYLPAPCKGQSSNSSTTRW